MKKIIALIFSLVLFTNYILAQKEKTITVKAGREIKEFFPADVRYRYKEFMPGRAVFKNGVFSESRFNYNLLNNEMEFLKSNDTLYITNKKELNYIVVENDTFLYENGFIEIISDGPVKVGMKKYYKLNEIEKKDSYGTSSHGSARESYNSMQADGNFYKLKALVDMVFQKTTEYYIAKSYSNFVPYRRNNVTRLFPEKSDEIKKYLRSNKIDFNSEKDILKLAGYLSSL
jgi:hypothetical protein